MLDVVQDYFIVLSFTAYPTDGLEEAMDSLMDALLEVESVTDPDITASLTAGTIDVAMYVRGRSNADAIAVAEHALAEAIHHSGGLADWEERAEEALRHEQYEAHVRRADLRTALG
ncbi:hypothetical protein ACWEKT_32690 [Nocardia takedensis]